MTSLRRLPVPARPGLRPAGRKPWDLRLVSAAAVGVVLWAITYLPNLTVGTLLVDEPIYLRSGAALLEGDTSLNQEHPPLAKLLFGLGGRLVGEPLLGGRLVAALCGGVIAWAVYRLVSVATGRGWGLLAAAGWLMTPHALRWEVLPWGGFDRLDRYALLDPVATAFGLLAIVAAVRWWRDERWRWGILAGVMLGLAAGAKVSALLLVPAVAVVPLLRPDRRWSARSIGEGAVVAGLTIVAFSATYLPLGAEAVDAFRYMVDYQGRHASSGHGVVVAGRAYRSAPWWAQAWYAVRDEGLGVTVSLWVLAGAGMLRARSAWAVRVVLATAVAVPLVVFALSPVLLPHYRFLWLPPLMALAAIGLASLWRRGATAQVIAAVLVVPIVLGGVRSTMFVATRQPADYPVAAAKISERAGPDATVLVRGFSFLLTAYEPAFVVVDRVAEADAVVLDPKVTDRRPAPQVRERVGGGGWEHHAVDRLDVWVRR